MERPKNSPLDTIEWEILNKLIFRENLESLVEEVGSVVGRFVVADVLKGLLVKGLVQPMVKQPNGLIKPSYAFDSDNLHEYFFIATAKGIDLLN